MAFSSELVVREIGVDLWQVVEDLHYDGNDRRFTVPAGTTTDFASVPKLLRWFIPKYGRYNKAAVLHDYLVSEAEAGRFDRSDADGLFRRAMRELNVGYLRRRLMWAGVRWGGRLEGGTPAEKMIVLGISVAAGPFAAAGLVAAQLLVWLYQLVEMAVHSIRRLTMWLLRREPPKDQMPRPTAYYRAT